MLHTQFPRPRGDVGHPETFMVPIHKEMVRGIWPANVVATAASLRQARIVPSFQAIVRNLEVRGAKAITTSCGFLVLMQNELQSVVRVPVVTSSLLQLPALLKTQQRVGVLTISGNLLGKEFLKAAGVPRERLADVAVQGVDPKGEFATRILGNQPVMDLTTRKVEITTQNHGFAVDADSLKGAAEVTHLNLNDNTVEGLAHRELPIFSVQYHPESSPGPHDASYLFRRFTEMMEKHRP